MTKHSHEPGKADGGTVTSGQAARAAGISRKALRLYEEKGLVTPAGRTAAGYRLFTDAEIGQLRFIHCVRVLGLGLDDIAVTLAKQKAGEPVRDLVGDRLANRLREIDDAIRELRALRDRVASAADRCACAPAESASCPVFEHAVSTAPGRCCE